MNDLKVFCVLPYSEPISKLNVHNGKLYATTESGRSFRIDENGKIEASVSLCRQPERLNGETPKGDATV